MTPARSEPMPLAFTVAQARAEGWSRSEVDRPELERPFHGVRTVAAFDAATLEAQEEHRRRAQAYSVTMGDRAFFSHVTAAAGWGIPLPSSCLQGGIDVCVWAGTRNSRARGVNGHTVAPHLARVVDHPELGWWITSPASTWAMLGSILPHPYDLIAAADAIVREPQHPEDSPALGSLAQLHHAAAAGRRVGVDALRLALPRVRVGSSSRPETWTRLVLVDAGLPDPELAHAVFDRAGRFVARVDLAYPRWRIAIEYEGEHHFTDSGQWTKDILRYERLAAEGWLVIRVTKKELFREPAHLVERVSRALASRG